MWRPGMISHEENPTVRQFQLLGIGKYLPPAEVLSSEFDVSMGLPIGTAEKLCGVRSRRYARDERVSVMAAKACESALQAAGVGVETIDAIVYVGSTAEQILPCTACFVQSAIGPRATGIPCFDINATCLSFLVGLDQMTLALHGGRYRRVLLVSAEVASGHLNPGEPESALLFGDGAIAFLLGAPDDKAATGAPTEVLGAAMETHAEHVELCRIRGGMQRMPAFDYNRERHADYCFHMDGPRLFKHSLALVPRILERFLDKHGLRMEDIACFVPHQASLAAMELFRRRLNVDESRWVSIIADHGNQISASIPMAFHAAVSRGQVRKGDVALLVGTGAGLAVGMMALRY